MKNRKALILLFSANFVSAIAQGMTMVAIPWFFIKTLDLPSQFAILYLVITAVSIPWTLYSGTLIDRFDRKNIFIGINIIGGSLMSVIGMYGFDLQLDKSIIVGAGFVITFLIYNIHFPSLYAFAQEISDPKDYGKVTSYLEILHQFSSVLAGVLALVLLTGSTAELGFLPSVEFEKWEIREIFIVDGLTYFIAMSLIVFIRYQRVSERIIHGGNPIAQFKGGVNFLKENPYLLVFGALSYAIFISVLVAGFLLVPILIVNFLSGEIAVFAKYEAAFSGGAIAAGIFIYAALKRIRPSLAVIGMGILASIAFFLMGMITHIGVFIFLAFVIGLMNAGTRIMRATYVFRNVPNTYIGRVGSVFHQFHILFRILFIWLFAIPFFSEGINITYAFFILGSFILLCMIILIAVYKKIPKT